MLRASLFEPDEATIRVLEQGLMDKVKQAAKKYLSDDRKYDISRVCLVATAISGDEVSDEYFAELTRTYRNPGLAIENIERHRPAKF